MLGGTPGHDAGDVVLVFDSTRSVVLRIFAFKIPTSKPNKRKGLPGGLVPLTRQFIFMV